MQGLLRLSPQAEPLLLASGAFEVHTWHSMQGRQASRAHRSAVYSAPSLPLIFCTTSSYCLMLMPCSVPVSAQAQTRLLHAHYACVTE